MSNYELLKRQYIKSAENLEKAKAEFESVVESGPKQEFYRLKYMGFILQNEMCREFFNLESNPTKNESKLAALAPVILALFEAYIWYRKEGNPRLRELARERGMFEYVETELKRIKALKAGNIEAYSSYRNKLAGHFDLTRVELINHFGKLNFEKFEQDAVSVISYGNEWIDILKNVGLQKVT